MDSSQVSDDELQVCSFLECEASQSTIWLPTLLLCRLLRLRRLDRSSRGSPKQKNITYCEFLPLQLEILSKNPMIFLLQVVSQNDKKIKNSTTSDLKCLPPALVFG